MFCKLAKILGYKITLHDLFCKLTAQEFDDGGKKPVIFEQHMQGMETALYYKKHSVSWNIAHNAATHPGLLCDFRA